MFPVNVSSEIGLMRKSALSTHKLWRFSVIGSYFIYYLQKKIYLGKKIEEFSSELFPGLSQQLNFYAGYFLASLLFLGNIFF